MGKATLVDMPGYGYAAVSKEKSAAWGGLARDYLRGRPKLLRVFVLVDGRHGLKERDQETMRLLDAAAVSYAVVLTKGDEVKAADQSARIAATLEALRKHVAAYPEVIFTSARTGEGVGELRAHIARLIAERTGGAPIGRNETRRLVLKFLSRACPRLSPQRPEERPHVVGERVGLFHRGEMAPMRHDRPAAGGSCKCARRASAAAEASHAGTPRSRSAPRSRPPSGIGHGRCRRK